MRRIKSLLDHLIKMTWCIWIHSNEWNWTKSHAQDGYAQPTIKMDMLAFLLMKIERYGMGSKKVNSSGFNLILLKLEFIGMSCY